ncbi:MAG: hypothetical protein Q8P16_01310, partial [bacterium]|nr:hypothetical protein [bacterium]
MIPSFFKKYKVEVLLFCAGFGIRFAYALLVLFWFGEDGFLAYSDAFSFYLRSANNLVTHGIFSINAEAPFMPDAYRPPLYILVVAGALFLKLPLISVIFLQNVLGGLIGVLVYRIGRFVFSSPGIGIIAA